MKNPQHSKKREKKTKTLQAIKPVWVCEYRNYKTGEDKLVILEGLKEYAMWIVKKALEDDQCYTVEDLFVDEGIPVRTYYTWIERYDFFREAHNNALVIIGRRREKKGLTREWDSLKSMDQYNKRWRDSEEWRSSLKQKEDNATGKVTVVMQPFDSYDNKTLKQSTSKDSDNETEPTKTPEEIAMAAHKIVKGDRDSYMGNRISHKKVSE